jgi:hypothetical protein
MQMKLLLIDSDIDDVIKSVHIVSNKQATYICPLHCKPTDNIYNELFNLVSSHNFHHKATEKWFDTGDYDWFDFTLLTINAYE